MVTKYLKSSFFPVQKLFYWFIAIVSLFYFEHLVSSAEKVTFSEVYSKNWFLSTFVVLLLLGIIIYAFLDAKSSIKEAKETTRQLNIAKFTQATSKAIGFASWFTPWGWTSKIFIFGVSKIAHRYIDNKVEQTLSSKIIKTIEIMLVIATINLSIILISTYLITNKILFW